MTEESRNWRVLAKWKRGDGWVQVDQDLTEAEAHALLKEITRESWMRKATPNMTDEEAPIWGVSVKGHPRAIEHVSWSVATNVVAKLREQGLEAAVFAERT